MPVNAQRRKKLTEILPEGIIATREWLLKEGLSRHALDNLVKSNQLEPLSKGVYVRGKLKNDGESIIYSLQSILKKDFVVGGLTALDMQGLGHYLFFSKKKVFHLYGIKKTPPWLNKLLPDVLFIWHNQQELTDNIKKWHSFTISRNWNGGSGSLVLSSPERAYLEVLTDVPNKISFEHADQLMQGLTALSPRKLQELLEVCTNVKAKRLFFWFAERHNHIWLRKLDVSSVDLGVGNRALVKGGKLDKKYKITVPEIL
jgi:hypothetical protein